MKQSVIVEQKQDAEFQRLWCPMEVIGVAVQEEVVGM